MQQFRKATFAERAEPPLKQIPLQFLTLIRTFYLSKLLPSLSFSYRSCKADWLNKTTNFLKWDLWTLISLRKIPKFYLISWYENFVERRSFRMVSFARNYAETVPFHKISTPGNQVKLRYFTQCFLPNFVKYSEYLFQTVYYYKAQNYNELFK